MTAPRERSPLSKYLSLSFNQPLGTRVADGGYHLDLRTKTAEPAWPRYGLPDIPLEDVLWVARVQWGLAAFEHFVHEADERWLVAARQVGEHVLDHMTDGGPLDGALRHRLGYWDTYAIEPGWVSAMAQGEAASLLVRLHRATGEERFADGARRLLGPIRVHSAAGGAGVPWAGGWWPEEYPTEPPSFVLNGGVLAILGIADAAHALHDDAATQLLADAVGALARNLRRWDLGWWSRYELYPRAEHQQIAQVASLAYHELHEDLLRALDRVVPDPRLREQADRFAAEGANRLSVARAMAAKIAFRLIMPRRNH